MIEVWTLVVWMALHMTLGNIISFVFQMFSLHTVILPVIFSVIKKRLVCFEIRQMAITFSDKSWNPHLFKYRTIVKIRRKIQINPEKPIWLKDNINWKVVFGIIVFLCWLRNKTKINASCFHWGIVCSPHSFKALRKEKHSSPDLVLSFITKALVPGFEHMSINVMYYYISHLELHNFTLTLILFTT